jgi:hypothetical protein
MTTPDATIDTLAAAGFPVDTFTDEQLAVFGDLTPPEIDLIVDIKRRLDAVEPEVQAHAAVAGAALF